MLKITIFGLVVALCGFSEAFAESADEAYAREWVRALLFQQKIPEAQSFIEKKRAEAPRSVTYLILQGQIQVEHGLAAEAERSFAEAESIALENKEFFDANEARYRSALAIMKQGRREQAIEKVRSLQSARGFQDFIAESLERFEQNGQQSLLNFERNRLRSDFLSQEPKHSFRAAFETGYDSNVALLPDSVNSSSSSTFMKPFFGYSYSRYLVSSPLELFASASLTHNLDSDARTSNNLPLSLRAEWRLPGALGRKHNVSVVNTLTRVYLTHPSVEEFLTGNELALKKIFYLAQDQQILVTAPVAYNRYPTTSGADNRTGASFGLRGEHFHQVGDFHVTESLGYVRDHTSGNNFRSDELNLGAGLGFEPIPEMKTRLVLNHSFRKYPSSDLGRSDAKLGVAAVVNFRLHPRLDTSLSVNLVNNRSNVELAKYSKRVVSINAAYVF